VSTESAVAFEKELRRLLGRFRDEFELTIVEAIGCLEAEKYALLKDLFEETEEDE